jgi:hypothetical protein
MNSIQKRFALFLFGCILLRSLFVYITKTYTKYLKLFAILSLIPIIGWINIMFFNPRDIGLETGGEKIWWKDLRKVHLTLYILFFITAIQELEYAWVFLLMDVLFGLTAFLIFHYNEGNFRKLVN